MNIYKGNEVLFFEPYAAGQSLKNFWTRLASTYGCIKIILSRGTLTIHPHWFAKGLLSLLCLDLNHEIPISNIIDVTVVGKWFKYGKVKVHFGTMAGEDKSILLYMKKYHEFIDKIKSARN